MNEDIKIIEYDDWIQIFIDGVLKYENHSISGIKILNLLGIEYGYLYVEDDDEDE